jgi:GT2 family glycosyltransferase
MTGPVDMTQVGAVVIGRNEGARLIGCLTSLKGQVARIVYVDSGSTDGSQDVARAIGAQVVEMAADVAFTAARARNAGLAALMAQNQITYVQFVDGDCEVQPDWIAKALDHLHARPNAAVVCGRRRERFPEASVWNWMIDAEWDTPIGQVRACGGDALMRTTALAGVDGFDARLIAGEEPELCVRLRQAGWSIWRIDAEMTLHDAAMTKFSQWWQRNRRAGHAYAEGAAMHGAAHEHHKQSETRRAVLWGIVLPTLTLVGLMWTPWALIGLLIWPAQILRLVARGMDPIRATFLTFGKIPEAIGVAEYWIKRLLGRKSRLIEYK